MVVAVFQSLEILFCHFFTHFTGQKSALTLLLPYFEFEFRLLQAEGNSALAHMNNQEGRHQYENSQNNDNGINTGLISSLFDGSLFIQLTYFQVFLLHFQFRFETCQTFVIFPFLQVQFFFISFVCKLGRQERIIFLGLYFG